MSSFLFDLRVAARRLLAARGSTLVAIVTLSIGIGTVSTVYALFSAATDDLPRVPDADRIARIYISDPTASEDRIPPAPAEWKTWLEAPPAGVTLAVIDDAEARLDAGARAGRVQRVSDAYFEVAGVQPANGRRFDNGERGAVISRRLWDLLPRERQRLGSSLLVDGEAYAVVGVMPAGFWLLDKRTDVWLPRDERAHSSWTLVVARLGDVSETQTAAALTPVVQQLRGKDHNVHVRRLATDAAVRRRLGTLVMVGPALLVLIAVCANISALLVGALHARRRELAVRAALGAGRWRLARDVLCDAIVIAAIGGAASLAGAYWSIRALRAALVAVSPEYAALIPSAAAVLPVAFAAMLVAVIGIGYAPALLAARTRIVVGLAGIEPVVFRRGRYGLADLLLVLQIAMAAGLVLWTALFASVFHKVMTVAPHVPVDRVWRISITATGGATAFPADAAELILSHAAVAPGIEAAGLLEDGGARRTWIARSAGGVETTCSVWTQRISGAYFATHHFQVTGTIRDSDEVIANDAAYKRCGSPLSMREATPGARPFRVVGSVSDGVVGAEVMHGSPTIYEPLGAPHGTEVALNVLTRAPRPAEVIGLRDELERAFPRVMFGEPRSRAAEVEQQFSTGALITRLLGALAALTSLFGIVGLHAALAQALTARTREIGVRIALGAPSRNVIAATVGHHVPPAAIGIALGAGISIAGLAMLSTDDASMIRELALAAAMSPRWWIALIGLLLVTTLLSATVPVLRALRLSPADVLRRE